MPMGEGYWLDPRTGKVAEVTHHEKWIYDEANARDIGLSKHAFDEIRKLDVNKDIDEIRIIAIMDGLVRIRDYQNRVAIQFYADRSDVRTVLWAVHEAMKNIKSLRSAWDLVIGNLKTKEDVDIAKKEFDRKLVEEEPIMMFERKSFNDALIEAVEKKMVASKDFDERKVPQSVVEKIENRLNPTILDDFGVGSNNNLISEAGLSRLLQKFNEGYEFAILTAYRDKYDKDENIKRNRNLRSDLNSMKMGVYQLVGHWRECQDSSIDDWRKCPPDQLKDVIERSYMAVKPNDMPSNDFVKFILLLINKYEQDSALIRQGSDAVEAIAKNGSRSHIGKGLTLGKMAQAYSQHVRKLEVPFVFEGVEVPSSISGRYLFREYGILYPSLSKDEVKHAKEWGDLSGESR